MFDGIKFIREINTCRPLLLDPPPSSDFTFLPKTLSPLSLLAPPTSLSFEKSWEGNESILLLRHTSYVVVHLQQYQFPGICIFQRTKQSLSLVTSTLLKLCVMSVQEFDYKRLDFWLGSHVTKTLFSSTL